jgi:hypothetical protein
MQSDRRAATENGARAPLGVIDGRRRTALRDQRFRQKTKAYPGGITHGGVRGVSRAYKRFVANGHGFEHLFSHNPEELGNLETSHTPLAGSEQALQTYSSDGFNVCPSSAREMRFLHCAQNVGSYSGGFSSRSKLYSFVPYHTYISVSKLSRQAAHTFQSPEWLSLWW